MIAGSDNKNVHIHVTLDTGTNPDWISSHFLTEGLGLKSTRLNDEEKKIYKDFNGNKFSAIGKAEVMVSSTDFIGFPCRTIHFLVAKGGSFQILLGKKTIKKEKLLCVRPDTQGESAYPAVQSNVKKGKDYIRNSTLDFR